MQAGGTILLTSGILLVAGGANCINFPVGCTPSIESGVVARVTNTQTGQGITTAVLRLTEGQYTETLRGPSLPSGSYNGADERPGTYTLNVVAGGFVSQTIENVVVAMEPSGCHVATANLAIELVPTS